METDDIKVLRPFGPTIAKVKIPENLVKELNDYTDSIISNDQKKKDLDWGKNLVGNVKQEFVIEKDFMEKIGWGKFLATNVREWIRQTNKGEVTKFNIMNSWIVRQFNNEYNPIHYHDGHISGVGYLKIPKFVSKGYKKSKIDGTIDFINGNKMFLSDSIYNHQPKEGDVILFPHYLMHTAYPFKSSGERRSFSFNLEIDKKIANVFSR